MAAHRDVAAARLFRLHADHRPGGAPRVGRGGAPLRDRDHARRAGDHALALAGLGGGGLRRDGGGPPPRPPGGRGVLRADRHPARSGGVHHHPGGPLHDAVPGRAPRGDRSRSRRSAAASIPADHAAGRRALDQPARRVGGRRRGRGAPRARAAAAPPPGPAPHRRRRGDARADGAHPLRAGLLRRLVARHHLSTRSDRRVGAPHPEPLRHRPLRVRSGGSVRRLRRRAPRGPQIAGAGVRRRHRLGGLAARAARGAVCPGLVLCGARLSGRHAARRAAGVGGRPPAGGRHADRHLRRGRRRAARRRAAPTARFGCGSRRRRATSPRGPSSIPRAPSPTSPRPAFAASW